MTGGQLTCVLLVAVIVTGAVLTAWAHAWSRRNSDHEDRNPDEPLL